MDSEEKLNRTENLANRICDSIDKKYPMNSDKFVKQDDGANVKFLQDANASSYLESIQHSKNKKENTNYSELYGSDFTCPDCGRTSKEDNIYDAGNGFCQDCVANH